MKWWAKLQNIQIAKKHHVRKTRLDAHEMQMVASLIWFCFAFEYTKAWHVHHVRQLHVSNPLYVSYYSSSFITNDLFSLLAALGDRVQVAHQVRIRELNLIPKP